MSLFLNKDQNDDSAESSSITNWINIARIVVLMIVAVSLFYRLKFGLFNYDYEYLFYIFALYILASISFFAVPQKLKSLQGKKKIIIYAQILIDILFITLIIHFTGGIESRLAYLYIIPILSSSLISPWSAIAVGVSTLLVYYGHVYLEYIGIIKSIATFMPLDLYFSKIQLLRQAILVFVVTFSGAYYFQSIKKLNDKMLQFKDDLLFRTVHDVRSPIASIKWLLEKYQSSDFKGKHPDIQKDIMEVEGLLVRIYNLSENILMLAKGQKRSIKKELVSVNSIVQEILREVEHDIGEKNIKLEYNTTQNLPSVMANTDLIKEAFANIIGNSVKYNKQGGRLEIKHEIKNNFIYTSISNTGPAISVESMKQLFTPYFRGDEEHITKGTGLGLYISKKIIDDMGGSIGVESSTEQQTTFFISLPIQSKK
jgi:signal transduction histidine kinase